MFSDVVTLTRDQGPGRAGHRRRRRQFTENDNKMNGMTPNTFANGMTSGIRMGPLNSMSNSEPGL
jgi:hypothetical protein